MKDSTIIQKLRRTVVVTAIAGAATFGGHGVVDAYPPQPTPPEDPTPTTDDPPICVEGTLTVNGPAQVVESVDATSPSVDPSCDGPVDDPEDSPSDVEPAAVPPKAPPSDVAGIVQSPDTGTLPQTGGPGTWAVLVLAGAAVALGSAISGFATRSRRRALSSAA